jgi:hypothetical protein
MSVMQAYPLYLIILLLALILLGVILFLSAFLCRGVSMHFPWLRLTDDISILFSGTLLFFGLLYINYFPVFAEIVLYLGALLPVLPSLACFIKEKDKPFFLVDFAAYLLLLPCLQFNLWTSAYYFAPLVYLLIRDIVLFYKSFVTIKNSINLYTVKESLDELPWGLLISDSKGRINYLNPAFTQVLEAYGIPVHNLAFTLREKLREVSDRKVDDSSFIFPYKKSYLLFKEWENHGQVEMSLHDVTNELRLTQELTTTNGKQVKEQEALLKTLDELKALARDQEKERLHSLVHDTFAEEVSFVHQILSNPSLMDMTPLKSLVARGLDNYEVTYQDLEELESFYRLLGIRFVNPSDFAACPDKGLALELVREAIDNAIRHGSASQIILRDVVDEKSYQLIILNDGKSCDHLEFHNGLVHFKKALEALGGSLTISGTPKVCLTARFPKKHETSDN